MKGAGNSLTHHGPTMHVMGALFDAAVQRMEKGKYHVRYSPRLLQFSLMLAQKSPAAYRAVRACCPHLPTERHLSTVVNNSAAVDLPGSYSVPGGQDSDDDDEAESTPDARAKFRRTAGQGLHVPHPHVSRFTRRLEGLLQRTMLHPQAAATYRGDLFHHIAEQLRNSIRVRDMWRDVECVVNTGLRKALESKEDTVAISKRVSVSVLQYFISTYLLSKQKTWRIGMGMAPEYMSAMPTKSELRRDSAKYTASHARAQAAARVGLATEVLDAVFNKLSRGTASNARVAVQAIKDRGALEAARAKPRGVDGVVSATKASKREVDSALVTTYMAILRTPKGMTFSVVHPGASMVALQSGGGNARPRAGADAGAGAGAGGSGGSSGSAGMGGVGAPTGDVCVLRVDSINPASAHDIMVYGAGVHVGDYVLTVHSQRTSGRGGDRQVPTSILLEGDNKATHSSYPLHLLMMPHEAAFTAGAGTVPTTSGKVRESTAVQSAFLQVCVCVGCAHGR